MYTYTHTSTENRAMSGITDFLNLKVRMPLKFSKTTSAFPWINKAQAQRKTVIIKENLGVRWALPQ